MIENWELFAKYLSGECDENEEIRVLEWVASHPDDKRLIAMMRSVWDTPEAERPSKDIRALWTRVAERAGINTDTLTAGRRRRILDGIFIGKPMPLRWLRYAAVVIIAMGMGIIGLRVIGNFSGGMETVSVAHGKRMIVRLDDGSRVTLDAGSELVYPGSFSEEQREVFIRGEGYFEVVSEEDRPFIVKTNEARIRVLGTTFNVRAWEMTERVEVSVIEGFVSLGTQAGDIGSEVVIAKDQLSVLPVGGVPTDPRFVDLDRYLGWLQHEITFEDVPLGEVLHQLERWFELEFVIEDPVITEEHVTMYIKERSVDDILKLVSILAGLRYQRDGNAVLFLQ